MVLPAGPKSKSASTAVVPVAESPVAWTELTQGKLYAWQRPIVDDLCAQARPRVAYVQVARKNGKSRLAAAVILHEMCVEGGQVFLIADSERNLKSALFFELCTLVRRSRILSECVLIYKDHLECPSSGGQVSLRPNNLSASQSINPSLVCFDEVHMQTSDSIWTGMVLAGAAMPGALLLGITTPGYDVASLAHSLYEQVRAGQLWGRIFEPADPDCAFDAAEALLQANPILLDRPEMAEVFAFERESMAEHDYRRFRLGQWTAGATAWLPYGAWDARKSTRRLEPGERIWVGFDGSWSGDSTALVAATADGFVSVLGCWENPGKMGWRVPRDQVEDMVTEVFATYDVVAMLCDPPLWQREIAEWDRRYPGRVIEFPTFSRARMAPACHRFHTAVIEGTLTHDGDSRLTRHIANAVVRHTPQGDVVTKADKDSPAKIDLAIAAIVALAHAETAKPKRTSVFVV